MIQIKELQKRFPEKWIRKLTKGGGRSEDYLNFATVAQRLLEVVGPFNWKIIREIEEAGKVVGCVGQITCKIDGETITVEGVGTANNTGENSGEILKKAESDAFKRCARMLGLGLHLWAGTNFDGSDGYWLDKSEKTKSKYPMVPDMDKGVKNLKEDKVKGGQNEAGNISGESDLTGSSNK